jgi:hypothetical protein
VKPQVSFKALPIAARLTVVLFGLAGFAAILDAISWQHAFAPGRVLLLFAIAVATARKKVNLYRGSTISFLTCVVLLAVIKEGPAVAVLLAVCGVTVQTLLPSKKLVWHQLAFNAGMIAITVTAAWWTHHAFAGTQALDAISAELTATVLASFTYFLGNSISVSLIVSLSQRIPMLHTWSHHFLYSAPSFLIAGLLSLGVLGLTTTHFILIGLMLVAVVAVAYYCSINRVAATS